MPIGSCAFKIRSVSTMSSAARLEANTAGEKSRATRARVALVSATRVWRSAMLCFRSLSDTGADIKRAGRLGLALGAAEQGQGLVDRSLVGFRKIRQAFEGIVDGAVGPHGIGVEAHPPHREQLIAQHVANGAQLARPAQAFTQIKRGGIAAAIGEFREVDGD